VRPRPWVGTLRDWGLSEAGLEKEGKDLTGVRDSGALLREVEKLKRDVITLPILVSFVDGRRVWVGQVMSGDVFS
jgi:hypothetical protein